ncbi:BA75_03912T0 [Komagataella pastoris]|uniref:Protein farnesyltransferase subunit beta n=1 Tax=Komagataella pastoris TaxID=4922 RepID=A0A1B2JFD9_PICPA|nr:BA75_03912T0 [Komagataella pastoris]
MSNSKKKSDWYKTVLGSRRIVEEMVVKSETQSSQLDTLEIMLSSKGSQFQKVMTLTTEQQIKVEDDIRQVYESILDGGQLPTLKKVQHLSFVKYFLETNLPAGFIALDASHTWMIFWLVNSLLLLGGKIDQDMSSKISENILSYLNEDGGFGGGAGLISHVVSSYAAVMALFLSNDPNVLAKIDRQKTYEWLLSLKLEDGSFCMYKGGEVDTRAVYCALVIASILDILTPELVDNTAEWLGRCQTFEGGFGGVPGDEAHGGYSFCAVAALSILGPPQEIITKHCDLKNLVKWSVNRQYQLEGGMNGRTNKLVDGCYSHWVGGIFPFLELATQCDLLDRAALKNYILICCQEENGGLRDKPGKRPDFYHTNYVLCGLSLCQHETKYDPALTTETLGASAFAYRVERIKDPQEDPVNFVEPLHPIFGIPMDTVLKNRKL